MCTSVLRKMATVLLFLAIPSAAAEDGFVFSDDDLPEARIAGHRIAFTRNGAIMVALNGHWLFGVGLGYTTTNWSEWGTQVRRAHARDSWEPEGPAGKGMRTEGTLFDSNRVPHFKFVQRARLIPGGLRLEYEVTPLEARKVKGFGIVVQCPVAETLPARFDFWPGFVGLALPEKQKQAVLINTRSRAAVLHLAGGPRAAVVGDRELAWSVYDDRTWHLNVFRLVGWDAKATATLSQGRSATFICDLLLSRFTSSR